MDPATTQLRNRVLCWLRLEFFGSAYEWHQRYVDVADVLGTDVTAKLADRFKER